MALLSLEMSMLDFFWMSFIKWSKTLWSKSSPPKWVSPLVPITSNTPSSMVRMETSNVPPPKSNTKMFFSSFWSKPQAMAAAVGSFNTLTTLRPEMMPASLVDCLWELSKQAGTVTMAFLIFFPEQDSAISFILTKTMAEISSGAKTLVSPLTLGTEMQGLPSLSTISQGRYFLSYWTVLSLNFLPMSLLTSQRVLVGLTVTWFLAASPMSLSSSVKATTEGVILFPSSLGMTSTCPFLKIPTQEQVVPRSMPIMGHSYFSSSLATARARITPMRMTFIIFIYYILTFPLLLLYHFSRVNPILIPYQYTIHKALENSVRPPPPTQLTKTIRLMREAGSQAQAGVQRLKE